MGINTEKYFEMIMEEMTSILRLEEMLKNEEMKQAMMNTLFDEDGPRSISTQPKPKGLFVANILFRGFSEIFNAVECLKKIEIYTRRFPFSNTSVSKLDYLKYNVENYLNEIYVLKERMISYSKTITRAYRKSNNSHNVEVILKEASITVSGALKNIVETRGAHVHSIRFTDSDIDRLSSIELMCKSENKDFREVFEDLYKEAYVKTRKKWVIMIKQNNTNIEKLLDDYCLKLTKAISNGENIVYPSNVQWT